MNITDPPGRPENREFLLVARDWPTLYLVATIRQIDSFTW